MPFLTFLFASPAHFFGFTLLLVIVAVAIVAALDAIASAFRRK